MPVLNGLLNVGRRRNSSAALMSLMRGRSVSTQTALFEKGVKRSSVHGSGPAPLVIFGGWMNATYSQMSKYVSIWHERGADTLAFAVKPSHVFQPTSGQQHMEQLAADVRTDLLANGERPIVFHFSSAGAYMYGQLLRSLHDATTGESVSEDVLLRCITGQVFDSTPISIEDIARGTAKLFGDGLVREAVLGGAANAYLAATKNTSGVHFRAASLAFHDNPVPAPSLWLYSKADATLDPADCRYDQVC